MLLPERVELLASTPSGLDEYTLFGPNRVLIAVVGVAFGIVWAVVNFYHLYPYVQTYVVPKLLRTDPERRAYVDPADLSEVPVAELPTIDILLPAYREGNVIHQSIRSIRQANYPRELVDINVLIEPEDDETRDALDELAEDYEFQTIRIPPAYEPIVVPSKYPGDPNKPRALNYGFELTDGDIVGVIDAEDIVDPDLFAHVYGGLVRDGHDYVQGILDMVNEDDGWLNLVFRSEYAWWFQLLLPAFHWTGYPVPLGGTTNFLHRSVLEEISDRRYAEYGDPWSEEQRSWFDQHGLDGTIPWDPRNVTEDFELGLFLWKEGYDLGLIRSVTREESPLTLNQWLRQRTRWQKGKVYSFVKYSHHRPRGTRSKFHLFLQSSLPHLAPINIAGVVILFMVSNALGAGMPVGVAIVLVVSAAFLVQLNVLHAVSYWRVSDASLPVRTGRTLTVLLTLQLYWIPLWGAELRALKQVYTDQLHWEKTTHHGRNGEASSPVAVGPEDESAAYTLREIVLGLSVLLVGLLSTFGIPILYFWL